MTNEVMNVADIQVKFVESEITIENKVQLDSMVNTVVAKYKDLIVTEATLADDKRLKADINRFKNAMDDERKRIKKAYNEPLVAFEAQIKEYVTAIEGVVNNIDEGVKYYEELQRPERLENVKTLIAEMAPNYGVAIEEVEIQDGWLIKTISNKKLVDGIAGTMNDIQAQKKALADKIETISKYCAKCEIDPEPFIGTAARFEIMDIMQQIDNAVAAKQAKIEREKAKADAALLAKKATLQHVGEKLVDSETGTLNHIEQQITFTIQGTPEQINGLAWYLTKNQLKTLSASERTEIIVED